MFSFGQKLREVDDLSAMQNEMLQKLKKIKGLLGPSVLGCFLVLITRKCSAKTLEMKIFLNQKDLGKRTQSLQA